MSNKMELDWWRNNIHRDHAPRYKAALEMFSITKDQNFGTTLDWGCGALCGILPYIKADLKYGVDPLWDEYIPNIIDYLHPTNRGIILHTIKEMEHENYDGGFDTIFSINAIDHGDSDFRVLQDFNRLLFNFGIVYLHVHLRTQDQLNEGHDHCLTEADFVKSTLENGFEIISKVIMPDPLPIADIPTETDPYRTLIAILTKVRPC